MKSFQEYINEQTANPAFPKAKRGYSDPVKVAEKFGGRKRFTGFGYIDNADQSKIQEVINGLEEAGFVKAKVEKSNYGAGVSTDPSTRDLPSGEYYNDIELVAYANNKLIVTINIKDRYIGFKKFNTTTANRYQPAR